MSESLHIILMNANKRTIDTYLHSLDSILTIEHQDDMFFFHTVKGKILTNSGLIDIYFWYDTTDELFDNLYTRANGALIFYDCSNENTFKEAMVRIEFLQKIKSDLSIILCGIKTNLDKFKIDESQISVPHYQISPYSKILDPLRDLINIITKGELTLPFSPFPIRAYPISQLINNAEKS